MKTYLRNVWMVAIVLGKVLVVIASIMAFTTAWILPALLLGERVHWALGVAYGVVSIVLLIAALGTWLDKAKSETPIHDWLKRLPGGETWENDL